MGGGNREGTEHDDQTLILDERRRGRERGGVRGMRRKWRGEGETEKGGQG